MLTQLKITVRKGKSCERTLLLNRVTGTSIFFLVCSTTSNNSENGDIFIKITTRPRSTPQPLVTKTMSTSSLRGQTANTQNKLLTEGKIYFDGNLTSSMNLVYCAVLDRYRTSKLPSPP